MNLTARILAISLLVAAPATAQDIEYQTASRIYLPGGLGKMMSMAAKLGGGSSELMQTTYIKGLRMRTDDPGMSTIFDLTTKRWVMLDHKQKTYTEVSTEEMRRQLQAYATQSQAAQVKPVKTSTPDYKVSIDPTNETEVIADATAKRSFMTVIAPMRDSTGKKVADFVVLTDSWIAKETPIAKAQAKFSKAAMNSLGGQRNIGAVLGSYPGAGEALAKAAEEASKMEGYPMRMTFHMILVPDGIKYDRQLAIAESDKNNKESKDEEKQEEGGKKKKGGLGSAFGSLKKAAQNAAKKSEQPPEEQPPHQMTLLRLMTEVKSVKTGSVDASVFQIPANYKKATPEKEGN